MSRIARKNIFASTKFLHIMVQGIAREGIFLDDNLKRAYLSILVEKNHSLNANVAFLAYCIMDNHAHFVVTAPSNPDAISLVFQRANLAFAQLYNAKMNRVGYVFRSRFKAQPILTNSHLLSCIAYVHQNPVSAKMLENATDYLFSSASEYRDGVSINTHKYAVINKEVLIETFGEIPHFIEYGGDFFIDDEYEGVEKLDDVINEIKARDDYKIDSATIREIKSRTRQPAKNIANALGISATWLAKLL